MMWLNGDDRHCNFVAATNNAGGVGSVYLTWWVVRLWICCYGVLRINRGCVEVGSGVGADTCWGEVG